MGLALSHIPDGAGREDLKKDKSNAGFIAAEELCLPI